LQGRTLSKVTILANLNINAGSITIGDETFTNTGFVYQVINQTSDTLNITKSSDFDGSVDYLGCRNSEVKQVTDLFGNLSGNFKWVGIASADNGLLYCAPLNSTQVLEIDPINKTTSLFGNLVGSDKWQGIAKADNGLLYCAPLNSTQVLEIDPINKTTSLFGNLSGTQKWTGIAKADNGLLYCAPVDSDQVLEIDPINKTTSLFGNLSGGAKYRGIVSASNGMLYCTPFNSTEVLEIDPVNKATNQFGNLSGTLKWQGIANAKNGFLYCAPVNSTQVLEIGNADGTVNGSPSVNFDRHWQQSDGNQQIKKTAGTIKLNDTKLVLDSSNTYTIQSLVNASYGDEIVVVRSGDNEPVLILDSADIADGKLIQYGFRTDTELTLDTNDTYTLFFNGVNLQVRRG